MFVPEHRLQHENGMYFMESPADREGEGRGVEGGGEGGGGSYIRHEEVTGETSEKK